MSSDKVSSPLKMIKHHIDYFEVSRYLDDHIRICTYKS
jgi:hypothetical protein